MQFEWKREGPVETCGSKCRVWVSAFGAITSDTHKTFEAFAKTRELRGGTIVLDSGGGSVLAAISLGRAFRNYDVTTTVGRTIDIPSKDNDRRAKLSTRAECGSMCAFVLLGGTRRHVPAEAQVLVHQIWMGDRREDATAASYTAEDLVIIQRDIGRLARFTVEMGGGIDLLETALKIPPWERMRALTRDELRRAKLHNVDVVFEPVPSDAATSSQRRQSAVAPAAPSAVDRGWSVINQAGAPMLMRRHPLTVQGEDIGVFDLLVACGETTDAFAVTYLERRRIPEQTPERLREVSLSLGHTSTNLKIVSSEAGTSPQELSSLARGAVPVSAFNNFAESGHQSLTVATHALSDVETAIRVGNSGASQNLQRLAASCGKRELKRAELQ